MVFFSLFYFCSDFYFLSSTNFGLCSSFSSSFRCKVRLFIWGFFVCLFLEVGTYCYEILLELFCCIQQILVCCISIFLCLKMVFVNLHQRIYLEGKRDRQTDRYWCEKHWLAASQACPKWDWTHNLGTCPDWESSSQHFGVWDSAPKIQVLVVLKVRKT